MDILKRLFTIVVLCIYLLPLIGIAKSTHYCMGNVLDVEYFSFQTNHCCCEKEILGTDCCTDEIEVFQIDVNSLNGPVNSWDKNLINHIPTLHWHEVVLQANNNDKDPFVSADLPPPRLVPIYIITNNLQYYG